jgi:hypothetical protein
MPSDRDNQYNHNEITELLKKKLSVEFHSAEKSIVINLPLPFEMGVGLIGEESDTMKPKSKINPRSDGRLIPLYRGHLSLKLSLSFNNPLDNTLLLELAVTDVSLNSNQL